MVFTNQGQPLVYWEMSLTLFIKCYLSVLAEETDTNKAHMLHHLQDLMEDCEVYWWRVTRDFHAAWLQQMEQGRAVWGEDKLRRLLVLSRPALSAIQPSKITSNVYQLSQAQGNRGRNWYYIQNISSVLNKGLKSGLRDVFYRKKMQAAGCYHETPLAFPWSRVGIANWIGLHGGWFWFRGYVTR